MMTTNDKKMTILMMRERNMGSAGSNGSEKRMKPYVPIFSKTPARMTEPAVGASGCASGSQVWNGNMGTLMANAKKKPQNNHTFHGSEKRCAPASKLGTSKVRAL